MPFTSPFAPVDIPDIDLWALLFERKHKPFLDEKEIFTDGETGRTYTFGQVRHAAVEFGKGLKAKWNWKKGDVLAFYTPNSCDTAAVTLGVLWAGGVASPANPLYTADELVHQLNTANAKAIVTMEPMLPTARDAARRAGIPDSRIILIGERRDQTGKFRHFCSIRSTSYTGRYARTKVNAKRDLAFLVFSSGTTGLPKGVCLTHYNMVANVLQWAEMPDAQTFLPSGGQDGKGDRQLGVLPFFHIYGLMCSVITALHLGWHVVIMERFDLEKACKLIQDYRITWTYIPPPIVLALGKHPAVDKYDLSSLKLLHSAAAPLTRELTEAVWARLKVPVKQGYGLSETSPVTHSQGWDEWARCMGSVGRLAPNMEAKIVDEQGAEVPDGEPGELWVRGPNVFAGYLGQPELSRAAFSSCGYFKTGDIFRRDAGGNYYCVDRVKELIKYKGFQVPPAELEGLLVSHADVADACVVGVVDAAQATEVPRAYVVLRPGVVVEGAGDGKAREIAEWMAAKVAPHKKLRGGVRFIEQIPKSPSGKILRRVLRDQVRQEQRREGPKL